MPDWEQFKRDFVKEIWDVMSPEYHQLLEHAYGDQSAVLGTVIAFDLNNPRVRDILDQLFTRIAGVTDTTIDDARALVAQQSDQGWSADTLAQKITELGMTQSPQRANVIAVTETSRSYSLGSQLYWRDAGVEKQEWLVSDPCEVCAPLAGKVVGLDDEFASGIRVPGDPHPSCKCALSPVVDI